MQFQPQFFNVKFNYSSFQLSEKFQFQLLLGMQFTDMCRNV